MYTVYSVHGQVANLLIVAFWPWYNIDTDKVRRNSTAYDYAHSVIYLTQTHLYKKHHTEKQLVPF